MTQAQPRRPDRASRPDSSRRRRGEPLVTDLEQRRRRRQAKTQEQNAKPNGSRRARSASRSKRPRPLLPFALGMALGYGLAGPLPPLASKAMASLWPHGQGLSQLIPFGISGRRILVLGSDKVSGSTDVMFTVQIKDGKTLLTQVPRDTFVESSHYGILKANALYAFGGLEAIRQDLPPLVGGPVDSYLKVNLRAVQRVAEALGGVEVDVPKRMVYVDNSQGLYIDLYPGRQVLKGEQLEGFLRFRHDELGDLGRMERQKLVLNQIFRQLANPTSLAQLPQLLKIAGDDIKTDLSVLELGQLLTAMTGTKLSTSQIPGRLFWHNDLSYWMPNSNNHYPVALTGSGEAETTTTTP
ncbi:MAG: LytR family transcriptional regulator [Cyanobacteria bacterium K_Offshore_0m_m2_072]|nr:LytR family transcriptional regulator [Cyanobacteria bacterium K_Offshore_0m_m2_072]